MRISGQTVQVRLLYPEHREFLCPGDEVIFICRTIGSQTLEWRSDQYTNPRFLFKFASHDPVGGVLHSPNNRDVFINLTSSSRDDDEVIVMESQLHIRVEPNTSSTFSVRCLLDNLEMDDITPRVLGVCTCT